MENRKRRRNANKNGSKWKVQAGKNNTLFTRYNRKNKLVNSILHEIEKYNLHISFVSVS